eukprot:jgi/Ulvmu1/5206/UM216_0001.1
MSRHTHAEIMCSGGLCLRSWRHRASVLRRALYSLLALVVLTLQLAHSHQLPTGNHLKTSTVTNASGALGLRRLLDAGDAAQELASAEADADITVVATTAQLQAAIAAGDQDIELRAHLDLSDVPLSSTGNQSEVSTVLRSVLPSTRSIRGNCLMAPPPAAAFRLPGPDFQWTAPQCFIVSDHDVIIAVRALWVDALHLRHRPARYGGLTFVWAVHKAELYATRLTVQGSGPLNASALLVSQGGTALCEGCIFDNLGGNVTLAHTDYASSLVLHNCTFSNVQQSNSFIAYNATHDAYKFAALITAFSPSSSATVLDTAFKNIDAVDIFWTEEALIVADGLTYSNVTTERNQWDAADDLVGSTDGGDIVQPYLGFPREPSPVSALNSLATDEVPQLSMDDVWIKSVQKAIAQASPLQIRTAPDPLPDPPSPITLGVAGDAAPSVAAVYTAFEFQDAFHEGVRDIEIHDHLDLRLLPKPRDPIVPVGSVYPYQIGTPGNSTRSIRGKCTAAPAGSLSSAISDLGIDNEEPWRSPQCVLLTSDDRFILEASRLWLDSLYIQIVAEKVIGSVVIFSTRSWGRVYVTNTVVQGDRASNGMAVQAWRSAGGVYAEGCVFNWLAGDSPLHRVVSLVNGNAYFKSCDFRGLSKVQEPTFPGEWYSLVGALNVLGLNATLGLENCTIGNIYNEQPIVTSNGGRLFSDNPLHTAIEGVDYRIFQPLPLAGLSNLTARTQPPLRGSDPWLVAVQKALSSPSASAYLQNYTLRPNAPAPAIEPEVAPAPAPYEPVEAEAVGPVDGGQLSNMREPPRDGPLGPQREGTEPGGDSFSASMVAGISAAVIALVGVCAVFTFYVLAKQRRKRNAASNGATLSQTLGTDPVHAATAAHNSQVAAGGSSSHGKMQGTASIGGGQMGAQHFGHGGLPPAAIFQQAPGHPYGYYLAHPYGQQAHVAPGMHMAPQMIGVRPGGIPQCAAGPGVIGELTQGGAAGYVHGDPRHMGMHQTSYHGAGPSFIRSSSQGSATGERGISLNASTATLTSITKMTWSDFQKASGEAGSRLGQLQVALDAMYNMHAPFYNRYRIESSYNRRVGGQGVVQFASIAGTQDRAAIKLYMDRSAFERERQLYTESQLKTMMPATLAVEDNAAGNIRTPYDYVFPPFVVIECGQSLDEWARDNANKDFITIFQALSHAVRALRRLHDFGYAHRDIKPGNILRRPKQHDWTLIDFGCTAQIGSTAILSLSLKYAAPEVLHALEAGSRTVHVDSAVDIWAIGIIAFELLTGKRAFSSHNMSAAESEHAAQEAIAGRAALPWEGDSQETRERLEALRGMRRSVMRCLARDPAKRPTAAALVKSWEHMFDNMHTRGTDWDLV